MSSEILLIDDEKDIRFADHEILKEMILSNSATFSHRVSLFSFAIIYNDNH